MKKNGMKFKVLPLIVFCLLLLSGCATTPTRTPNPKDLSLLLPERVMIENIKIERGQSFRDCVPVAIEAVFRFYGTNIGRKEIGEGVHKSWGSRMSDVIPYVKGKGFDVYSFYDRTRDKRGVKFFLAQHLPVLVIGGDLGWQSHIIILVGYDDGKKIFHVADPERRAIQQERYFDFNAWHGRQSSYGFVIFPASRSIERLDGHGN